MSLRLSGALAAPLALLAASAMPGIAAPQYQITDLGTLPGGLTSNGRGINALGEISGKGATDTGINHAILLRKGQVKDLGALPTQFPESFGLAINDHTQITGFVYVLLGATLTRHAFLVSDGKMTDLGTLPDGKNSSGKAINNAGDIVGDASVSNDENHAALFSHGKIIDLNTAIDAKSGWVLTQANDITDTGFITGTGSYLGRQRGFLLTANSITGLGALVIDGETDGLAVNANGVVTGVATVATGDQHAFLSFNGKMTDLGTLTGDQNSAGRSINSAGDVVGVSVSPKEVSHGFIFEHGKLSDLNNHIDSKSTWLITEANAINDKGQIAATGYLKGKVHALLLTPMPQRAQQVQRQNPRKNRRGLYF